MTTSPAKLFAKDIARLEERTPQWALNKMNEGAFGELVKINDRLMYVYESGYLDWKKSKTRVFTGSVSGPRVLKGCVGKEVGA
jgi:hypothetical protein